MTMTDISGGRLQGSTAEQELAVDRRPAKAPESGRARVAVAMPKGALTSDGTAMASPAGPGRPEHRP